MDGLSRRVQPTKPPTLGLAIVIQYTNLTGWLMTTTTPTMEIDKKDKSVFHYRVLGMIDISYMGSRRLGTLNLIVGGRRCWWLTINFSGWSDCVVQTTRKSFWSSPLPALLLLCTTYFPNWHKCPLCGDNFCRDLFSFSFFGLEAEIDRDSDC